MKKLFALALCLSMVFSLFACGNTDDAGEDTADVEDAAEEVEDVEYSLVEYEYYYKSVHNYYYNMANQYESNYGTGYGKAYTGYDYTLDPAKQDYPGTDYKPEDGSTPTWKQYFEYTALMNMQRNIVLADMAKKAKFEISAEAQAKVESQLQELRNRIKENAEADEPTDNAFDSYLRSAYGKNMSEKKLREIVARETLATEYTNYMLEKNAASYTAAELEEVYRKDPSAYNCVDFRLFSITQKDKAIGMFEKITDEASFIKLAEQYATDTQKEVYDYSKPETTLNLYVQKSLIESGFNEDVIEWLYGDAAKVNEKKMFEENGTYYIFYMLKPSYRDNTTIPVDVRHILYQIDEEAADKEAEDKKQKAAADAAYTAITQADGKLAKFLELVEAESADTGSVTNGGLYKYVGRGQYVKEFEAWALDPKRQSGDIEVVKTDYGYHIMYFEKAYTRPFWQINIAQQLAKDDFEKQIEQAINSTTYELTSDMEEKIDELNEDIYNELIAVYY